jgi:hypothetical protein
MSRGMVTIIGLLSVMIMLTQFVSAYDAVGQNIALGGSISQSATNTAVVTGSNNNLNQAISQTSLSQYSQYFTMSKDASSKTHIKAPQKQEIKGKTPATVYFSYQMHSVPYSQYQTYTAYTGGNSLWIQGTTSWAQYTAVPQGSSLSLLAVSSKGGNGYLHEISPDGRLTTNNFYFYPYNNIGFYADTVGKHILLFIIDGQVSNSIVIDVIGYNSWYQQQASPRPYAWSTTPFSGPAPFPGTSPMTSPAPASGDTPVTISSQKMRGYQVFLDGNYVGTDGMGGDALDGKFSFKVVGGQNHDIRVYDGQFNYPKSMLFQKGVQKIIYMEPGTAVYV